MDNTLQTGAEQERKQLLNSQTKPMPDCSGRAGGRFGFTAWSWTFPACMGPKVCLAWTHGSPVGAMWSVRLETAAVHLGSWKNARIQIQMDANRCFKVGGASPQASAGMISVDTAPQPCSANPLQKRAATTEPFWPQPPPINGKFVLRPHNNRSHGKWLSGSAVLNTNLLWLCYFS